MYIVVSKWQMTPGMEEEFEERGRIVRELMRATPGVQLVESFRTENGQAVAVLGYESEEAYARIVTDEAGPFARAVVEHRLDEVGTWLGSERGHSV